MHAYLLAGGSGRGERFGRTPARRAFDGGTSAASICAGQPQPATSAAPSVTYSDARIASSSAILVKGATRKRVVAAASSGNAAGCRHPAAGCTVWMNLAQRWLVERDEHVGHGMSGESMAWSDAHVTVGSAAAHLRAIGRQHETRDPPDRFGQDFASMRTPCRRNRDADGQSTGAAGRESGGSGGMGASISSRRANSLSAGARAPGRGSRPW